MNVFYLDNNPAIAAKYHCDRHVVKMIIEYAQLMSTAHRVLDGNVYIDKTANGRNIKRWRLPDTREDILYKASHINHPSGVWCRSSSENYKWLFELFRNLCGEFTMRYHKIHKTQELTDILIKAPMNIPDHNFYEPPPAMPEYCKISNNSIASYRKYYIEEKNRFATWKSQIPDWYLEKNFLT
jgi:hypothetical protein